MYNGRYGIPQTKRSLLSIKLRYRAKNAYKFCNRALALGESWFMASNQENGEWFYIQFIEFTGNWSYKLANWWTGNTMELPVLYRLLLLLHSFAFSFSCFLSFLIWPHFPFLLFSSTFFHYFPLSPYIPSSVSLYIFARSSLHSFLIFVLVVHLSLFPSFMFHLPFSFTLHIRQDSTWAIFRTLTVLLSLSWASRCVAPPSCHLPQGSLRFSPTTHCI
jgi:hypothetical protein